MQRRGRGRKNKKAHKPSLTRVGPYSSVLRIGPYPVKASMGSYPLRRIKQDKDSRLIRTLHKKTNADKKPHNPKDMKKTVTRAFLLETLDAMVKRIINPESVKLEQKKDALKTALSAPEPLKALSVARAKYRAEAQRQAANLKQTGSTSGFSRPLSPSMFRGTYDPKGGKRGVREPEYAMYSVLKERTDRMTANTQVEKTIKEKMKHPNLLTIKDMSDIKQYLDFKDTPKTTAKQEKKDQTTPQRPRKARQDERTITPRGIGGVRRDSSLDRFETPSSFYTPREPGRFSFSEEKEYETRRSRRNVENIFENIYWEHRP